MALVSVLFDGMVTVLSQQSEMLKTLTTLDPIKSHVAKSDILLLEDWKDQLQSLELYVKRLNVKPARSKRGLELSLFDDDENLTKKMKVIAIEAVDQAGLASMYERVAALEHSLSEDGKKLQKVTEKIGSIPQQLSVLHGSQQKESEMDAKVARLNVRMDELEKKLPLQVVSAVENVEQKIWRINESMAEDADFISKVTSGVRFALLDTPTAATANEHLSSRGHLSGQLSTMLNSSLSPTRSIDASETSEDVCAQVSALVRTVGQLKELTRQQDKETQGIKKTLAHFPRDIEDLTNAIDGTKTDVEEIRAGLDTMHNVLASRQRADTTLQSSLDRLGAQMETNQIELDSIQTLWKDNDKSIGKITERVRDLQSTCDNHKSDLNELKLDLDAVVADADGMKDSIVQQVAAEIEGVKKRFNRKYDSIQESVQINKDHITSLDSSLQIIRGEFENFVVDSKSDVSSRLDTVNQSIAKLQEQVEHDCKAATEACKQQSELLSNEINSCRTDSVNQIQVLSNQIKAQLQQMDSHSEQLKDDLTRLFKHDLDNLKKDFVSQLNLLSNKITVDLDQTQDSLMRVCISRSDAQALLDSKLNELDSDLRASILGVTETLSSHTLEYQQQYHDSLKEFMGIRHKFTDIAKDLGSLNSDHKNHSKHVLKSVDDIRVDLQSIRKLWDVELPRLRSDTQAMRATVADLDTKSIGTAGELEGIQGRLEELVKGIMKLSEILGVLSPKDSKDKEDEISAMDDGNAEDGLASRLERSWNRRFSNRCKSILTLISKKADSSLIKLLQISQEHLEEQMDRIAGKLVNGKVALGSAPARYSSNAKSAEEPTWQIAKTERILMVDGDAKSSLYSKSQRPRVVSANAASAASRSPGPTNVFEWPENIPDMLKEQMAKKTPLQRRVRPTSARR
eukprot:GILJ01014035.1.p1 GENE.GILJ01014035.1~~GILJ01014035.1.p1  ORF type:complete len:926 (+),score=167.58 GILJ01014035.1:48-2780(+)